MTVIGGEVVGQLQKGSVSFHWTVILANIHRGVQAPPMLVLLCILFWPLLCVMIMAQSRFDISQHFKSLSLDTETYIMGNTAASPIQFSSSSISRREHFSSFPLCRSFLPSFHVPILFLIQTASNRSVRATEFDSALRRSSSVFQRRLLSRRAAKEL